MKVISIDPKAKHDEERKQNLLEVVEEIRKQIEDGTITELVACSLDQDGIAQIHASVADFAGGVGLFEIGKHQLILHQTLID